MQQHLKKKKFCFVLGYNNLNYETAFEISFFFVLGHNNVNETLMKTVRILQQHLKYPFSLLF